MDNEAIIEEIENQNDGGETYQQEIIDHLQDGRNVEAAETIDRYINHLQQLKGFMFSIWMSSGIPYRGRLALTFTMETQHAE